MDLTFHVYFEHKSRGHSTSTSCGTVKEVKETIELMRKEYDCTSIEAVLDITELIKENEEN